MVAGGALQRPAGVVDLAQNEAACIAAALRGVIGHTVLNLTQQYIASLLAHGAGQKASLRGEKHKVDTPAGAGAHQGGAGPGVGEADDAFQRVQGKPCTLLLVAADDNIFAIQRQIIVCAEHEQRVEQLSHGVTSSSMCARRYAAGSAR